MDWFNKMKAVANKWFGANFNEDTTDVEMGAWFESAEQKTFEQHLTEATDKIKAEYNTKITDLEAKAEKAVSDLAEIQKQLDLKTEETNKLTERANENETSIETLAEEVEKLTKQSAEQLELMKSLAEGSNEKFAKLEEDNKANLAKLEEQSSTISERDKQIEELTSQINILKGKKSGAQDDNDGAIDLPNENNAVAGVVKAAHSMLAKIK